MVGPESRHVAITPSVFAAASGRLQHEVVRIEVANDSQSVPSVSYCPDEAVVLLAQLPFAGAGMLIAGTHSEAAALRGGA